VCCVASHRALCGVWCLCKVQCTSATAKKSGLLPGKEGGAPVANDGATSLRTRLGCLPGQALRLELLLGQFTKDLRGHHLRDGHFHFVIVATVPQRVSSWCTIRDLNNYLMLS
jgi:hypothetical protein